MLQVRGAWLFGRDYPSTSSQLQTLGSGSFGPTMKSSFKSGQSGPSQGRGRGQQVRFGGMNVLYDDEGNEYTIDELWSIVHTPRIQTSYY